jgi:hypothetical protein
MNVPHADETREPEELDPYPRSATHEYADLVQSKRLYLTAVPGGYALPDFRPHRADQISSQPVLVSLISLVFGNYFTHAGHVMNLSRLSEGKGMAILSVHACSLARSQPKPAG